MAVSRRTPGPVDWQWDLTCFAWAVHAAGADRPGELRAVQRLGGVTEIQARQKPFAAWREGRSGLAPGAVLPGTTATTPSLRRRLGHCAMSVGEAATATLARLVATALTGDAEGTGGQASRDVDMEPVEATAPPPLPRSDPGVDGQPGRGGLALAPQRPPPPVSSSPPTLRACLTHYRTGPSLPQKRLWALLARARLPLSSLAASISPLATAPPLPPLLRGAAVGVPPRQRHLDLLAPTDTARPKPAPQLADSGLPPLGPGCARVLTR